MKSLFLVRHAKAESNLQGIKDFDRPLHPNGILEANLISLKLLESAVQPDLVVSSSAIRANSTALIFMRNLKMDMHKLIITKQLYEIEADDLLSFISEIDNKHQSVMLFGHNPSFTILASGFDASINHMPTCSVICFDFSINSWDMVVQSKATCRFFFYPS